MAHVNFRHIYHGSNIVSTTFHIILQVLKISHELVIDKLSDSSQLKIPVAEMAECTLIDNYTLFEVSWASYLV